MVRFNFRIRTDRAVLSLAAAALVAVSSAQSLLGGVGQPNVVSYTGTANGPDISSFLGATTFYNAGYIGSRSTIANISGGLADNTHETDSKISQLFAGTGALTGASAVTDHETFCSSVAAGRPGSLTYSANNSYSLGIAYGASLWSGNVATAINQSNGSFNTTTNSVFTAYYNALIGGVNGTTSTANIVTSSWGQTSSNLASQQSLAAGFSYDSMSVDAVVVASHKLVVFAAGNNGTSSGDLHTPGSPASGNNALVVGASGNPTTSSSTSYTGRVNFSAYGPSTANAATGLQTGTVVPSATAQRARVDIMAPGVGIVGASKGTVNGYEYGDGTSFATPIVAGGAGLVEDAGQTLGYTNITDNRVVTAILQNSATQLAGWTNGATTVGGVSRTTQALDFQQGAGQMNLDKAYDQLTGGTHDVAGTGGGAVLAKGWDYGELGIGGSNDYTMSLLGGTAFESTLRFNGGATFGTLGANSAVDQSQLGYSYLSNFSLQLLSGTGSTATLLAESNAQYITSELFNYAVSTTGLYTLRVNYLGDNYAFTTHGAVGYGLAWYGTQAVPEPTTLAAFGLGALAMLRRRKRA